MNNKLEEALNKPRNYGIGRITTLKLYLPVFSPEIKRTYIENRTSTNKKTKDKYEYYIWTCTRGLEIPKIVYDSLDLPEEIVDNRID